VIANLISKGPKNLKKIAKTLVTNKVSVLTAVLVFIVALVEVLEVVVDAKYRSCYYYIEVVVIVVASNDILL